jgi:hypothetical protein
VRPAQRRRGIGRGQLDWLLDSARVAGIRTIGLEVRADNAAALAFYRRLGFVLGQAVGGYYTAGIAAQRITYATGTSRDAVLAAISRKVIRCEWQVQSSATRLASTCPRPFSDIDANGFAAAKRTLKTALSGRSRP